MTYTMWWTDFDYVKEDLELMLRVSAKNSRPAEPATADESIVHAIDVGPLFDMTYRSNISLTSQSNDSSTSTQSTSKSSVEQSTMSPWNSFQSSQTYPMDIPTKSNVSSFDPSTRSNCLPGSISRRAQEQKNSIFRLPVRCKHFDCITSPVLSATASWSSDTETGSASSDSASLQEASGARSPDTSRRRQYHPPLCRICLNTSGPDRLLRPCNCRGPFTFAHHSCLVAWIRSTQSDTCDVCRFTFLLRRRPPRAFRFLQSSNFRRRLCIAAVVSATVAYVQECARLTTLLARQSKPNIVWRLIRLHLIVCTRFWNLVFTAIVLIAIVWQTLDFVRWRRNHFDLEVTDNPKNLLQDFNVPPRNSLRASGMSSCWALKTIKFLSDLKTITRVAPESIDPSIFVVSLSKNSILALKIAKIKLVSLVIELSIAFLVSAQIAH